MSSPMPLVELQRRFQRYVERHGGDVDDFVVGDATAGAVERMDVYAHAYRLRLVDVLANDFPALEATLGKDEFDRVARAYLDARRPTHFSVRWFGAHLALFLRTHAPGRPVLAEIAAFEWAQGEAFDARDAPLLTADDVARLPADQWPRLRLTPHPSLRRVDLEWNAAVIARAVDESEAPPAPEHGPPVPWLLWRRDLVVRWRSLPSDEAAALDAVRAGATFGEVCELLCAHVGPDAAAMHAASLLKRWLADGLFAAPLAAG
jgi:hypothetical protein